MAAQRQKMLLPAYLRNILIDAVVKSFEEYNIAYFGVATHGIIYNKLKLFPMIFQYFEWRKGGLESKLIGLRTKQTRLPTQLPLM